MEYEDHLRFGTVGTPSGTPGTGTCAAIEHTARLGLHHLEIAWVRSVKVLDTTCDDIKAQVAQFGVSLSVHAPYFINLNSQTTEKMEASDKRLLAAARKGYRAGARDIVFHPGSYHQQPVEQVYERIKQKLLEITGILREEGVNLTLRPETMGKASMFGDFEEVVQLSEEVPGVLPCIDWAHLHARHGEGSYNDYAAFDRALKHMRDRLGDDAMQRTHSHMSGIDYGPKGERAHLPLNESDFRYQELLQALVDHNAAGTVGTEAPHPFHVADCLTFQATYRRLLDRKAGRSSRPRHGEKAEAEII